MRASSCQPQNVLKGLEREDNEFCKPITFSLAGWSSTDSGLGCGLCLSNHLLVRLVHLLFSM